MFESRHCHDQQYRKHGRATVSTYDLGTVISGRKPATTIKCTLYREIMCTTPPRSSMDRPAYPGHLVLFGFSVLPDFFSRHLGSEAVSLQAKSPLWSVKRTRARSIRSVCPPETTLEYGFSVLPEICFPGGVSIRAKHASGTDSIGRNVPFWSRNWPPTSEVLSDGPDLVGKGHRLSAKRQMWASDHRETISDLFRAGDRDALN